MTTETQKRVAPNSIAERSDVLVGNLHHSCISVERTISLEELGVKVENMPQRSKKILRQAILPEDFIRPYQRIIQQAKAFFARYGTQCEVGTVFNHARGKQLIDKMMQLEEDMRKQLETDRENYKEIARKHMETIAVDPDVRNFPHRTKLLELLEQRQPLWDDIESKIFMTFSVVVVGSSSNFDGELYQKMQDSIVAIKKGAFGSLIRELCEIARNALDKAIKAETRVHSRTVKAVWAMVEKLNELGFLDKRLRAVEKELRRFLAPLNCGEALRDLEYEDFVDMMVALSNQHWVVQKLDSNEPLFDVWEEPALQATPVTPQHSSEGAVEQASEEAPTTEPQNEVEKPAATLQVTNEASAVEHQREEEWEVPVGPPQGAASKLDSWGL